MNTTFAQSIPQRNHSEIYFSDTNEVLGKCIYFFSASSRKLIKQKSIGYLFMYGNEVKDSLLVQKVKFNGQCKFLNSSLDTFPMGLILRLKCKVILYFIDSSGNKSIQNTLKYTRIKFGAPKPKFDFSPPGFNEKLNLNGYIQNETRFGTATYTNQELPKFYSRTQFAFGVDALGVPLKVNYFISTENGSKNDINNFQVSLNVDEMKKKLSKQKESLYSFNMPDANLKNNFKLKQIPTSYNVAIPNEINGKNLLNDTLSSINDSLKINFPQWKYNFDSVKYTQTSIDTLPNLKKPKNVLTNYSFQGLDSLQKLRKMNDLLKLSKPDYKSHLTLKQLAKDSFNRIHGKFGSRIKERQNYYSAFLGALNRFETGNIILNFSPLWANGINIKGVKIGLEKKGVELNLFGGNQNRVMQLEPIELGKRSVYGAQVGYAFPKHFKLSIAYLYGYDSKNPIKKTGLSKTSLYPENNHVLNGGLDFIRNNHELNFELSKSVTKEYNSNQNYEFKESSNKSFLMPGTAFQVRYKFQIPKSMTEIYNSYSHINSNFNSFGLNFLRKDIRKYELKVRQIFFRKLQTTFGYISTNTLNTSISAVSIANKTYSIQAGVGLKGYIKRVSILAVENNFKVSQLSDTTIANRQRMGSVSFFWLIPISSAIKFNSAWNYCLNEVSMDGLISYNSTATLSSSLKIKNFSLLNDISFLRYSDSISQSQNQVGLAYERSMFRTNIGCKYLMTNNIGSNRIYFLQADFVYRKTRAGIKYEFIESIAFPIDTINLAISGGYILTIHLAQTF